MTANIKVVQVGLGPIGNTVTRYLLQRGAFQIVGAVDVDPEKEGRDIGELAGLPPLGVAVVNELEALGTDQADVAIVATASSLRQVLGQILAAVRSGLNVVSTCEELAYPWRRHPETSREIDEAAKGNGVSVLGTGINPGFLMDFLPVAMTGVCLDVERVKVERIFDASQRRRPFQVKIGAGLSLEEFAKRAAEKTLRHVGLSESMDLISTRLGWTLDRTEDVVEPVIASQAMRTEHFSIEPGQAIGVSQTGRAWRNGKEVLTLSFRATLGERESYDRIRIEGTPNIDLVIQGGINGDIGTGAVTVNAIPPLISASPGLKTMADLGPISYFNATG